jgi:TRAP-type transport system periplasmic protein
MGRIGYALGLALILVVSVSVPFTVEAGAPITLKIAHVQKPTENQGVTSEAFAKEVSRRTNGQVRIAIFPLGQLGGEREILEGLRLGTIDFLEGGVTVAGPFFPPAELLGLPYLFRDEEHYRKAVSGPLGKELGERMAPSGLRGLGFHSGGFRHIANSIRPINTLADLKDMKLRLREVETEVETFKALGAIPVPIPWPETYTALQTGVVAGLEQPLYTFNSSKIYEVTKYISMTGHFQGALGIVISEKTFQALSPAHKQAIVESATAALHVGNEFVDRADAQAYKDLQAHGMKFNTVADLGPFKAAVKPVVDRFLSKQPSWVGEMVNKISATR